MYIVKYFHQSLLFSLSTDNKKELSRRDVKHGVAKERTCRLQLPLQRTEENQVCVVHLQGLAGESFVYFFFFFFFCIATDLRIEWRSFKLSADGEVRNLPNHHIEWMIPSARITE